MYFWLCTVIDKRLERNAVYVIRVQRKRFTRIHRSLSADDENRPDQRLSVCNMVKGTESVVA